MSCMSLLLALLLLYGTASASPALHLKYVFPVDGSEWRSPGTSILMCFDGPAPTLETVQVNGARSGPVDCEVYRPLYSDRLVLLPEREFQLDETVEVRVCWRGGSFEWSFRTRPEGALPLPSDSGPGVWETAGISALPPALARPPIPSGRGITFPSDFPEYELLSPGTPGPGNFFLATLTPADLTTSSYTIIMDNSGEVLFYWHWIKGIFGVRAHTNGLVTMGTRINGNEQSWLVMDSTYTFVDTFTVNGYTTDIHGIAVMDNGNYLMQGVEGRFIDMSQIVPGGNPNAWVEGLIIQEQDQNHVTVFEWSSFDHLEITEAAWYVDLTAAVIDYTHCNSVNPDFDGNIIASLLAFCSAIKIDHTSGEVMWKFGGLDADTSYFQLIGDPLGGFSAQHDFQSSEPAFYTVFDNGRFHSPSISRGLEYELDTDLMTATLTWSYQEDGLYGTHMGSTQNVPGGNYVIGWGDVSGMASRPDISEVSSGGAELLSMRFTDPVYESYTSYKFDWEGQALVPYLVAEVDDQDNVVILTYNVFGDKEFDYYRIWYGLSPDDLDLLLTTPENQIGVWELPMGWNYFGATAIDFEQVETGMSNVDSAYVDWTGIVEQEHAPGPRLTAPIVTPTPFTSTATVCFDLPSETDARLEVFDLSGRMIDSVLDCRLSAGHHSVALDCAGWQPAVYLVRLSACGSHRAGRFVLTR